MLGNVLPLVMGILGNAGQSAPPSSNPLSSTTSNVITVEGPSVNVGVPGLQMQPGNSPYSRSWPSATTPMQYPPNTPYSPYAAPSYYPYQQAYGRYQQPPALSRWTRMVHELLEWEKTLNDNDFAQLEKALNVTSTSTIQTSSSPSSKYDFLTWRTFLIARFVCSSSSAFESVDDQSVVLGSTDLE